MERRERERRKEERVVSGRVEKRWRAKGTVWRGEMGGAGGGCGQESGIGDTLGRRGKGRNEEGGGVGMRGGGRRGGG